MIKLNEMNPTAERMTTEDRMALARDFFGAGHYERLELSFRTLMVSRLSGEQRVECARMARLAGWPAMSLKFLRTRPEGDAACAEYAAALAILGASREARRVFDKVDAKRYPGVLTLRAVGHITTWEFEEALRLLEVNRKRGLEPLATELRATACELRSCDRVLITRAVRRLEALLEKKWPESDRAWHVFAQHLRAEARYYTEGDPKAALNEISNLIDRYPEHDMSVPRVLRSLLTIRLRGDRASAGRAALDRERRGLRSAGHWHLLRLADFHEACILGDEELYLRVHFGTPFSGCRRLLRYRFPRAPELPATYDWYPGKRAGRAQALDVAPRKLLRSSRPALLLAALSTDFYRPISEVELHEMVFGGRRFEHEQSSLRVRVAVHRLRKWLLRSKHSLSIASLDGSYWWSGESRGSVRVRNPDAVFEGKPSCYELQVLRERFRKLRFRAKEAAVAWDMPLRTAQARLFNLVEGKHLAIEGQGPATSYRVYADAE